MLRGPLRTLATGVIFLLAAVVTSAADAQPKDVSYLADQLKNGADFRVRTQAALALGASDDQAAVRPLCEALDDQSDAIRSAAAAALGRLGRSDGIKCLRGHLGKEESASVRSVIERSATTLEGGASGAAKVRPPGPGDKYYIALGPVTDKTGRGDQSVVALVTAAMQERLLATRGYVIAPPGESAATARNVVKKWKLKAFFLQTRVETPASGGADLTIQLRMTMWTYPGKALQGEFSPKLTMSGVAPGDKASEDNLIRMAVDRAIASFAQVAASSN